MHPAVRRLASAASCIAWFACGMAQGAPGQTAQGAHGKFEEIVVTARRISEPLAGVPLAIDVLDRNALIAGSVADLASLARRVPGLYFESLWGGVGSAPVLRGQAQPSTAGDNVGVFVDGVYQAERTAIDVLPLDVERIEVVHGPQSTLFGHATFAGAIHFVPRSATRELGSGVELGAGTDDYWSATGFLSGPIAGGALLGRLAAGNLTASGTHEDAASGDSLGDLRRTAVAAAVTTAVSDQWNASLSGRWTDSRSDHPAVSTVDHTDYNCGAIDAASGAWSYYCGSLPLANSFALSRGVPSSTNDVSQVRLSVEGVLQSLTLEADVSYYLGESEIFRDFDATSAGETFGVCAAPFGCPSAGSPRLPVNRLVQVNSILRQSPQTEEWSLDLRLHDRRDVTVDWMLGAAGFVTREEFKGAFGFERADLAPNERLTVLLPLTPGIAGPVARANSALVDDPNRTQVMQSLTRSTRHTAALYGVLGYRPTDRLGLRAEARATWERLSLDSVLANFAPSFGRAIPRQHFTDVTPRFSVDFRPAAGALLYASAAKGSRSGGINAIPGLLPSEQQYEPEYNWTYELAARHRGPERRWGGSATLYYIDWQDTQLTGFPMTPDVVSLITRNTVGVTTRGVELALDAPLSRDLCLRATFAHADSSFASGSDDPGSGAFCGLKGTNRTSSFCAVGPDRSGNAAPGTYVPYLDGNALQRAPRYQWHVGLRGVAPAFSHGWSAVADVDLNYQDDVYDRAINGARYGERTLLSARAGLTKGAWTLELWGTNLTDETYVRAVSSRGAPFYPVAPRPLDLVYGEGRRIGLTVRYDR